MSIYQIVVSLS
jgi:hypothetical protein